ncbi:MAG: hypothetical protein LBQ11_01660 [Candidatus Nomurabacteria bacterium]|jgi:hypothetical protein|nr:hypothetical protein [Candidatus Nomurabacteria bacterium]
MAKKKKKPFVLLRPVFAAGRFFRSIWRKIVSRARDFLSRRPHRSFYLTPREKRRRTLRIHKYLAFAGEVWSLIWRNKRLFLKFIVLYALLSIVIIGLMSQENFAALRDALNEVPNLGFFSKYSTLFSNAMTSGPTVAGSGQQILAALLFLYGWLTLIWLLRRIVGGDGSKLKLRDGLYGSGASVLATMVILLVILVELLPFALVLLAYASVTAVGWINTGIQIENMAAWCALAVAAVATLYWICSSFLALVIVTLPGMYPFRAIRAAGDLVIGRRLKLVLRLLFMMLPMMLMWLLILIPAILVDGLLGLTWQPLVPIVVLLLTTLTLVWCAAYIYLLYRKMVDDPAPITPTIRERLRRNRISAEAKIKANAAAEAEAKTKSTKSKK